MGFETSMRSQLSHLRSRLLDTPTHVGFPKGRAGGIAQWLILTVLTVAFVTPRMVTTGTNIVTETYRMGAKRLLHKENLYTPPTPGADRFEYSPCFALVYSALANLPTKWQAFAWAALNCALFWMGVGAWFRWERHRSKWLMAALVVCSMELNISVLYQQVNAALIGLTLLGLAAYRDEDHFKAGVILAIATEIKLLPGIFAGALLLDLQKRYVIGLLLGGLIAFAAPALLVGWEPNLTLHSLWIKSLGETWGMARDTQLDILSVFRRWGFGSLGSVLRASILGISALLLLLSAFKHRIAWYPWIGIGACCLLLVSPRSESPTFVLMAPAYIFLTAFFVEGDQPTWTRRLGLLSLCAVAFLVTISFTDLWARKSWAFFEPGYPAKTIGTALLWLTAVMALGWDWLTGHQRPIFLSRSKRFPAIRLS